MDVKSFTRKGPRRVWKGYRNLRVPIEIFPEVKEFMERRKIAYLYAQKIASPGADPEKIKEMANTYYPIDRNDIIADQLTATIERKIYEILGKQPVQPQPQPIIQPEIQAKPTSTARNLTTKERVEEYIKSRPNIIISNSQIAEDLNMPGSSVREATRKLAKLDQSIEIIPGRPNKVKYNE